MANKQISDLQARTFDGDSIIPHDVENTDPSTMSQHPYLTGSATGHAVADFVGNGEIYTTDLNTVDKHINGAINEHHSVIGYSYDEYDPTTAYSKDDLCIYNNTLYKAKQATTGNLPTNTTYWEQTSIADEIGRIDTALSGKADNTDLGGYKLAYSVLEGNGGTSYSPQYTDTCIAIVARGRSCAFTASNADVQTLVSNPSISAIKVSGVSHQIRISNSDSTTSVVTYIYR